METKNDSEKEELRVKKFPFSRIEFFLWVAIAGSMYVYPIARAVRYYPFEREDNLSLYILRSHYIFVLFSILIFLFPLLFKLIFSYYPFEYLRVRNLLKSGIIVENKGDKSVQLTYKINTNGSEDYKEVCIKESKLIAEKIYTRSGVYLLSGTLIAFLGIGIFYSPLFVSVAAKSADFSQNLLDNLPRFGALLFIEFIAFFFLRQFKIMHEEYRYYEAIKRDRQDKYNLLLLIEKYHDKPDMAKLISEIYSNNSTIGKLGEKESTQILETQKIVSQEADVFGKITELIKEVRRK